MDSGLDTTMRYSRSSVASPVKAGSDSPPVVEAYHAVRVVSGVTQERSHSFILEGKLINSVFEVCSIPIEGQPRRGVKIKCGHCNNEEAMSSNTTKGRGDDSEQVQRMITSKFEKHGWKVGKTPAQNRCPSCFTAIKLASVRKSKERNMENEKVVPLNATPSQRAMTRDERYLIFTKIDENYDRNKGSYTNDWTDEKVAKDFNVPRIWVSTIRDENFGPDTNEQVTLIIAEATELHEKIKAASPKLEAAIKEMAALSERADKMINAIRSLEPRKGS